MDKAYAVVCTLLHDRAATALSMWYDSYYKHRATGAFPLGRNVVSEMERLRDDMDLLIRVACDAARAEGWEVGGSASVTMTCGVAALCLFISHSAAKNG